MAADLYRIGEKGNLRARSRAMTLVELLVAVLIIQIVTAVALPSYITAALASRLAAANTDARTILESVEGAYIKNGSLSYIGIAINSADVLSNLSGSLPANPCMTNVVNTVADWDTTGTTATKFHIKAKTTTNCSSLTATTFTIGS